MGQGRYKENCCSVERAHSFCWDHCGYWARLILGKKEKLSYKLYEIFLYHLKDGAYVNSWMMNVENILDNVGLSYVWNSQQCVNSKWIVASVKTTLYDQFLQKCRFQI